MCNGTPQPWVSRPAVPRGFACQTACHCVNELARLHCSRGVCGNAVVRAGVRFKLRVVLTEKKGAGVLADEDIPSGQFVIEYIGEVVTEEEADRREKIYAEKQLYLSFDVENEDTAQYTIDTTIVGNAARFVNHSCQPNMVAYDVYEQQGCPPRIIFVAIRDVPKGEELTINYHPSQVTPDKEIQLACQCQSPECCGWVYC